MDQEVASNSINGLSNYDYKAKLEYIQQFYYMKFLMEEVRVTFKKNFSIKLDELDLDAKEGEIASVPRWLAQILMEDQSVEFQDTDVLIYLSRSLNRQRIAKPHDLSSIDLDFYVRVNDYVKGLKENEKEPIMVSLNSFIASRIEKIVKLAAASPLSADLEKKLSAEEKELYNFVYISSYEFRRMVNKSY